MRKQIKKRLIAAASSFAMMASMMTAPLAGAAPVSAAETEENFARLLQHSMTFYDANYCGADVTDKSLFTWRGDCHTCDEHVPLKPLDGFVGVNLTQEQITALSPYLDPDDDGTVDVSGGFHDAGDHVEFGMPENYTAATLGWGYYEFRDAYEKSGTDEHIETILRHFNDYLMRCTFLNEDGEVVAHCYQVGDGDNDHMYWKSPEADTQDRPAFFLTDDKPQVDYALSAAASLIINSLNFQKTDPEYAEKSYKYGKALYDFAWKHIAEYPIDKYASFKESPGSKELRSDNGDGPKRYYLSDYWEDDFVWCALWMYTATKDTVYLDECLPYLDFYAPSGWAYCWNDMWNGASMLLTKLDETEPELDLQERYRTAQHKNQYDPADFSEQVRKAMETWATKYSSPQGYAFLNQWGSARYDTAMQLICLIYDKYKNGDKPSEYSDWAKGQMEYLLGHNDVTFLETRPADAKEGDYSGCEHGPRCFVVGYNEYSAKFPHHRAASGTLEAEDPSPQRHVLYGALVGGPDGQDRHNDVTSDYIYNEVTIDYNAAFVGAAAGLYHFYGKETDKIDENFPPEDVYEGDDENGGKGYWVEAFTVDDLKSDGAGTTKVSFLVRTAEPAPADQISVRYYFDASEIKNIGLVKANQAYDQSESEDRAAGGDGIITETPIKYDKKENTYYIEVSWDGYKIANSGKKYQFIVGMYYGDFWDPTNDYSYQELPRLKDTEMFGKGNEVRTDYICVYSDGVLVGGIEPDGTTPDFGEEETKPSEEGTNAPTTDVVYGDVDVNGTVDILDVVAINKSLLGGLTLSKEGKVNADVDLDTQIDSTDALNILKAVVKLTTLPVKSA